MTSVADLKIGEYYIHVERGICQYQGCTLEKDGMTYAFLFNERKHYYLGETNVIQEIRKYDCIGKVQLSDLFKTKKWQNKKRKAYAEAHKIAEELVAMYAQRSVLKGFKFPKDTILQKEFESSFPYIFTEGQQEAIKEIKQDMESDKPMNVLLDADVGYGKSTVAQCIAFKCIQSNKQAVLLAPTSVLAEQHYKEFSAIFKTYDTNIALLSSNTKDKDSIIKDIESGVINIIIGTHSIITNKIKFKDLGVLIIDEEQRFGVKQKEQLKEFKSNIDVVSMTATPIPRTLYMAMADIIHVVKMKTPPKNKKPIMTKISAYNSDIIKEAIYREINRNGQVYFLYNDTLKIYSLQQELQEMLPDVKIGVAHGKMKNSEMQQIITDFKNKKYDILLCTTIIEIGVTIKNANTMIIKDANKMGLSTLYQLRGRCGRNDQQAYCYLLYDGKKALTSVSKKRLKALEENTELGSCMKLSEVDLAIRGAGEIVGTKQHGNIAGVGVEFFNEILQKKIKELKL